MEFEIGEPGTHVAEVNLLFPRGIVRHLGFTRKEPFGISVVVEDDGEDKGTNGDDRYIVILRDAQLLWEMINIGKPPLRRWAKTYLISTLTQCIKHQTDRLEVENCRFIRQS